MKNLGHLIRTVYLPTLLIAIARDMLIPILPLYVKSFDVGYAMVGIALAGQGIGNMLGDVPAGIILGRIGRKRSMILGIVVLGGAMTAIMWSRTVAEVLVYQIIGGMGMSLWNLSRHAYIAATVPVTLRGRAIAIFGGVNRVGTFIGPAFGGFLAALYGLQLPFGVYGVLAAAALIFPLVFVDRSHEPIAVSRGGVRGHTDHLASILKGNWRVLIPAGLGQICASTIRSGRNVIIPLVGADIFGLDVQSIGLIVSLSSGIDMSLFPVAGWVMDHWGRKYAYVPSFVLQGVGMALIPFAGGFTGLLAASMLIGFGNGLSSGAMMTLGADLAPPDDMAEFLGIWRLIGDSGRIGGPAISGGVAEMIGLIPATFVIAGIGVGAAGILGLFVPETLVRTHEPSTELQTNAD